MTGRSMGLSLVTIGVLVTALRWHAGSHPDGDAGFTASGVAEVPEIAVAGPDSALRLSLGDSGYTAVLFFNTSCGFSAASRTAWRAIAASRGSNRLAALTVEPPGTADEYFESDRIDVFYVATAADLRTAFGPRYAREVPATLLLDSSGVPTTVRWGVLDVETVRAMAPRP